MQKGQKQVVDFQCYELNIPSLQKGQKQVADLQCYALNIPSLLCAVVKQSELGM